jgi:hypothetical protein
MPACVRSWQTGFDAIVVGSSGRERRVYAIDDF